MRQPPTPHADLAGRDSYLPQRIKCASDEPLALRTQLQEISLPSPGLRVGSCRLLRSRELTSAEISSARWTPLGFSGKCQNIRSGSCASDVVQRFGLRVCDQ